MFVPVLQRLPAPRGFLALALLLTLAQPVRAAEALLPPDLERLISGAAAQTDMSALSGIVVGAVAARPDLEDAILARVGQLAPDQAARVREAVRQALGEAPAPVAPPAPPPTAPVPSRKPEKAAWSGKIRLGGGAQFGGTNRQTLALGAEVRNEHDRWRHDLSLELDFIRNEADTLQRDIETTAQSRYEINQRWFSFGLLRYEDERPSPFEFRTTEIVGLGYRVITRDDLTLDVRVGPGLRQTKIDSGDALVNEAIMLFATDGSARVSDRARLTNKNEIIVGTERTTVQSKTAVVVSIIWSIDAEMSLTVDYDTKLPGEEPNTDIRTAVALVYGF